MPAAFGASVSDEVTTLRSDCRDRTVVLFQPAGQIAHRRRIGLDHHRVELLQRLDVGRTVARVRRTAASVCFSARFMRHGAPPTGPAKPPDRRAPGPPLAGTVAGPTRLAFDESLLEGDRIPVPPAGEGPAGAPPVAPSKRIHGPPSASIRRPAAITSPW